MENATMIMFIDNDVWQKYGVTSRPEGATRQKIIDETAEAIAATPGLLEAITAADLAALTEHNYHTAREAAELAIKTLQATKC